MKRKDRLTITLSKDILKSVDSLIDGKRIRNRSHAIEDLVSKSLKPTARKAIILAGGPRKGRVFAPLARINNKLLIEIVLNHLYQNEVQDVFICAGEGNQKIKGVLGDKRISDLKINYCKEEKPLGTAGVLKRLENQVGDESFLVMHGDVLTEINLLKFLKFHEDEGAIASIAVKPRLAERKFGKVNLQGNKITEFMGSGGDRGISIVNTGIYAFSSRIFELLPKNKPEMLEESVFPRLAKMGELSAFLFQGMWFDVSREADLVEARKRWKKRKGGG